MQTTPTTGIVKKKKNFPSLHFLKERAWPVGSEDQATFLPLLYTHKRKFSYSLLSLVLNKLDF